MRIQSMLSSWWCFSLWTYTLRRSGQVRPPGHHVSQDPRSLLYCEGIDIRTWSVAVWISLHVFLQPSYQSLNNLEPGIPGTQASFAFTLHPTRHLEVGAEWSLQERWRYKYIYKCARDRRVAASFWWMSSQEIIIEWNSYNQLYNLKLKQDTESSIIMGWCCFVAPYHACDEQLLVMRRTGLLMRMMRMIRCGSVGVCDLSGGCMNPPFSPHAYT